MYLIDIGMLFRKMAVQLSELKYLLHQFNIFHTHTCRDIRKSYAFKCSKKWTWWWYGYGWVVGSLTWHSSSSLVQVEARWKSVNFICMQTKFTSQSHKSSSLWEYKLTLRSCRGSSNNLFYFIIFNFMRKKLLLLAAGIGKACCIAILNMFTFTAYCTLRKNLMILNLNIQRCPSVSRACIMYASLCPDVCTLYTESYFIPPLA